MSKLIDIVEGMVCLCLYLPSPTALHPAATYTYLYLYASGPCRKLKVFSLGIEEFTSTPFTLKLDVRYYIFKVIAEKLRFRYT